MTEGILKEFHKLEPFTKCSVLWGKETILKRETLQKHSKVSGLDVEPESPGKREQNFLFSLRLGAWDKSTVVRIKTIVLVFL